MSSGLTRALGEFVVQLTYADVPRDALAIVRTGFTDCAAAMIAGSTEPVTQLLKSVLLPTSIRGEATLYFGSDRLPAPQAAWINGTAAHALDYDDVALRGHPSAVLVPALLAEGEALGSTGEELVTAYVAGYEVWADLVDRERGKHHDKGWHPTGIFGAPAAAAACARLRNLTVEQSTSCLAIAASQACGLMANFGTMTKPFHAGAAAHAGVMCARLAHAGMSGAADALEHPQGFLNAVSPAGDFDGQSPPLELGRTWQILRQGLSVKKYPICNAAHRCVDAIFDLMEKHELPPDRAQRVVVSLSVLAAKLLRNHLPQTGLAAKFSIEFAMASALIARRVGTAELSDAFVLRADVQEMMRRVTIETNENYDRETPVLSIYDQVRIDLRGGGLLQSERVRRPRGHPSHPLRPNELWNKFSDCVGEAMTPQQVKRLFDLLQTIEALPAVSVLYEKQGCAAARSGVCD